MRFKTKLSLGYGVILILMVSIAIVVYFSIVAMKETAGWVEHTYKVINNGKQLEKLLIKKIIKCQLQLMIHQF